MTSVASRYASYSRRRQRHAARSGQRLDIQGLRMVAVLTVFATHLWGWPTGGFIGVDVFFVISGFLITGNLLRDAEKRGTVSFRHFYWNRVRRIMPAATVVLILTCVAAWLLFVPFRAEQVGVDALFAFIFLANWHFAIQDTDYFAAADTVSPIQHYWSLSIEEQFYFVWPALIFAISVLVLRKAWSHERRMVLAGSVMGVIVAVSFGWALYQTVASPAWAYFDTFARVWELGVGAVLACAVGALARIPEQLRPALSWGGLGVIAASLVLLHDDSVGFPAPWALLPVAGAALVIAAGVGGEPQHQSFLRNPISGYIGDISYSLYLVHWPVIVLLATIMDGGWYFYATTILVTFALSIASYHLVENPLRRATWQRMRGWDGEVKSSTRYAAVGAAALLVAALSTYALRPDAYEQPTAPPIAAASPSDIDPSEPEPQLPPLAAALQGEIAASLQATEWPPLDPSMESIIEGPAFRPDVQDCGDIGAPGEECTWGSPDAPTKVVLVGNSVAAAYAAPLRDIAENSGGQIQIHTEAMAGCNFVDIQVENPDPDLTAACPARKQHAIDYINATKPDVVIIANDYWSKTDGQRTITPGLWGESMRSIVDKFIDSTGKVVFMAPPDASIDASECYSNKSNTPPDCVRAVKFDDVWHSMATVEQDIAESIGGVWIDSRPWFCSDGYCPPFVGSTPTIRDRNHISIPYGQKVYPVIAESFNQAGVF